MVDLHFQDVVRQSREFKSFDDGVLVNKGWRAMCKTCSTVHKTDVSEFDVPITTIKDAKHIPIEDEVLQYFAEMRAWNCCHEEQEPYDGFPEAPDGPFGIKLEYFLPP